tara:strand:- start:2789 stop:3577 length:789 start_codon:yes stop_codon:yes gene_type:complete
MISAYTTAFNLTNFPVSFGEVFSNWFCYFDEVVVSTTKEHLAEVELALSDSPFLNKIKIVSLDITTDDLYWDGKLKNNGLQNCSNDIVFQIDLDERISGDKKNLDSIAEYLREKDSAGSVMINVVNLFGDEDHYSDIGRKWYVHTKKGCYRGAVNFSKNSENIFNPKKSDTCELIDRNGDIVKCWGIVDLSIDSLKIFHLGYIDISKKIDLTEKFWGEIWQKRFILFEKGEIDEENLTVEREDYSKTKPIKHNFRKPLWPTL